MAGYIGVRCPVCEKKFDQQDDIVVCPACGAPHHRECYAVKNECAFTADHISGIVWKSPYEQQEQQELPPGEDKQSDTKACGKCGSEIPRDALFCHICGHHVNSADTPGVNRRSAVRPPVNDFIGNPLYAVYGGVNPDENAGGETVRDLAAYVGPSSAYYVPRFKVMGGGKWLLFPNFAALILNFIFFFYRKMFLLGFISLAVFVASTVPGYLYMRETLPITINDMVQKGFAELVEQAGITVPPNDSVDMDAAERYMRLSRVATGFNFFFCAVLSLFFNRLYYYKCLRDVRAARESVKDGGKDYRAGLMRLGGVSRMAAATAGIFVAVAYFISNTAVLYMYMRIGG